MRSLAMRFTNINVLTWQKVVALGGILLVALFACAPLLLEGAVDGHSIEYNLVWLKHFSAQLGAGDLYPRWLMGMNRGAGSPVFFYYAPLPFYLTSLGVGLFPQLSLNVQLAVGEWLLIALSGVAFFTYARRHVAVLAAAIAAAVYMLLPYHFEVDLWLRQDLGELTVYIWMPLILRCTEQIFESSTFNRNAVIGLAVTYAALMFSHLPTALLFSLCIGIYVLVLSAQQVSIKGLRQFAAGIALGVALAAVYWVPALFAQNYIQSDKLWTPYFDFHRWLYPARSEVANPFAHRLIALINITTILFVLFWLVSFFSAERKTKMRLLAPMILMATAWFLISPASLLLWEHAPALWKVQFPWRVVVVMDLATAIAAMHALQCWQQQRDVRNAVLMASVAGLLMYCGLSADVKSTIGPVDNARAVTDHFYAVRDGLDAPEYTTPWSQLSAKDIAAAPVLNDRIEYDHKDGAVGIAEWSPRRISLNVKLTHPTVLNVRQFYFPNWKVFAQGFKVALQAQPAAHTGLLRIQAPAGHYRLNLAMAPLIQEWVGNAVSVLAVLGLLLVFVLGRRKADLAK